MREASRWIGDDEDQLFGTRLLETIDSELARQLVATAADSASQAWCCRGSQRAWQTPLGPAPAPDGHRRRARHQTRHHPVDAGRARYIGVRLPPRSHRGGSIGFTPGWM